MNKYLSIGLAVAALTAFGQPLSAAPDRHGKNKGHSASAKHAQAAAPAKHAKAAQSKSVGHRKSTAPTKGAVVRSKAHAPQFRSTSPTVAKESVVRSKARAQQFQNAPTVALSGSQFRNTRVESRDRQFNYRSDVRRYRPPVDVYRNWDRDRVYNWNRHRYHWYGGNWVIFDTDLGYDYPTTYVYRDSSPSYSGSLAARVQSSLARAGYDPGPIDGAIGPQTRSAIEAFQADNGLPVTRDIDDSLLNALGL
jgi:hypothetical protein